MVIGILIFSLVLNTTLYFTLNSYFSTYLAQPEPCGIPIVYWNYMWWMLFCITLMIMAGIGIAVILISQNIFVTGIV